MEFSSFMERINKCKYVNTCRHISWKDSCLHCRPSLDLNWQSPSQDLRIHLIKQINKKTNNIIHVIIIHGDMPINSGSELEKTLHLHNSLSILRRLIILALYSISLLWLVQTNYKLLCCFYFNGALFMFWVRYI